MSEHPPAAASRGPRGRFAGGPFTLKTIALAALGLAAALLLSLPPARRPSPEPSPPSASPPPDPRAPAAPRPLTGTDPSPPPPAVDDGEGDEQPDTESDDLSSPDDGPAPTELIVQAEPAPRAPVTSEPLVPIEIVVQAEPAPRALVTSEPLVPVEIRADGELAPRTPVSTSPLVAPVLVDPPEPPSP